MCFIQHSKLKLLTLHNSLSVTILAFLEDKVNSNKVEKPERDLFCTAIDVLKLGSLYSFFFLM